MEIEYRTWQLATAGIDVFTGMLFFYIGLDHAQTYGLETIFNVTALLAILVAVGLGVFLARGLTAHRRDGTLYNRSRWQIFRGPGFIKLALDVLLAISLAVMIAFFFERHGSLEAWESWTVNPHQRTILSVSLAILLSAGGTVWIIIGITELFWWLKVGKQDHHA